MDAARAVVRYRAAIALAWLVAAAVLLPSARRGESNLEVSARILGSESSAVEGMLSERFASPFATSAILVASGLPAPSNPAGRQVLREIVAALDVQEGVARTFSYFDQPDPLFVGANGLGTFVIVGLRGGERRPDQILPKLRASTEAVTERLRARFPGATLRWTGEVPLNVDLWRVSTEEARAAERRTLPLTLALLVAAFGSLAAALLPVLAGVLATGLAFGAAAFLGDRWPLSILVVNVTSMLGLALGIDYALLTVSRFREARAGGSGDELAAEGAARYAGRTVALSGAAVAIGALALFAVPLNELRSAAVGGVLVVVFSVLLAATLLPGLLAWLGPRVEAGRLWPRRSRPQGERWRAWARRVIAHPWLILFVAGTPVALLAAQAARLNPQIPRGEWLPPGMESALALRDLEAMGRSGIVNAVRVVLELPEDVATLSREGWEATRRLGDALGRDPRVARVQSLRTLAGDRPDDLAFVSLLPGPAKRTFLSEEGDAVLLEVVPREGIGPAALAGFVRELRRADTASLAGQPGCRLLVGGLPAFDVDYQDAVTRRLRGVIALVVSGTLLALFAAFRSVLVPIKAVALNLLTVAASFGALVLVFQDGYGVRALGLAGPVDGVFPIVPPLVFAAVFGLSMDYEVFLVARVAEARRGGLGEDDALVEGLARTAGVITSAAAIMIAVFGAFTLGQFVLIKMLGFALAVAVFLDAAVVRTAIGPALLKLAGRWNWWPGGS